MLDQIRAGKMVFLPGSTSVYIVLFLDIRSHQYYAFYIIVFLVNDTYLHGKSGPSWERCSCVTYTFQAFCVPWGGCGITLILKVWKRRCLLMAWKFNSEQLSLKKLFATMNIDRDIFCKYPCTECAYLRKRACTGLWGWVHCIGHHLLMNFAYRHLILASIL